MARAGRSAGRLAHYGKFDNVQHFIALIGPKSADLDERIGYYGERLVLLAQTLGLNTCWVALTFSKGASKNHCQIAKNERLVCVLALGHGAMVKKIETINASKKRSC